MRKSVVVVLAVGFLLLAGSAFAAADGAALFKSKCAMCHGADGSAQTPVAKNMKIRDLRSDEVQKQSKADVVNIVTNGKGKMTPFKGKLTTEEIDAVATFVKSLKK